MTWARLQPSRAAALLFHLVDLELARASCGRARLRPGQTWEPAARELAPAERLLALSHPRITRSHEEQPP